MAAAGPPWTATDDFAFGDTELIVGRSGFLRWYNAVDSTCHPGKFEASD